MSTAIPSKASFTGAGISEANYKTAFESMHDYLTGLLGSDGVPATARDALLIPQENVLHNGDGRVTQRTIGSTADDAYAWDRNYVLAQSGSVTASQQTAVANGTPYMMRILQPDVSAKRMGIAQIIEGRDCKHLRGQAVTLQPRVKLSASQALRYAILEWTGTEDSVTSDVVNDWTSSTYTTGNFFLGSNLTIPSGGVTSQTPSAATLTDLTALTVTLGSSFNNLIVLVWTEATIAQNATLDLAWQLRAGSAAAPFQWRPYQQELAICQRYLPGWSYATGDRMHGAAISTTASVYALAYPVPCRGVPTAITVTGTHNVFSTVNSGAGSGSFSFSSAGNVAIALSSTTSAGSPTLAAGNPTLIVPTSAGSIVATGAEL